MTYHRSTTSRALLLASCLGGCGGGAPPSAPPLPSPSATPRSAAAAPLPALFEDRARELGIAFDHFNGMSGEYYFSEVVGPGVALFDHDGDGDLDVYLVQGHMLGPGKAIADASRAPAPEALPLTDRLFRNQLVETGSLGFIDVTASSGLAASGYGMGVAAGDYDNDGDVDLYVTNFGPNQLWRNAGDGTFEDVTAAAGAGEARWSTSASFVDYDQDGWLDLYVGNYVNFSFPRHKECYSATSARDYCGPLSYEPLPDRLLHNRGDGTFEDNSAFSQIAGEYGGALGVIAADLNGDRHPDIYVANDGMPNQMWIHQGGGRFANQAFMGGAAVNADGQAEASMGVDIADIDGDGDDDIFLTHLDGETNTLYLNDGAGAFFDATRGAGLDSPSRRFTGFGTAWLDYDNDGALNLFTANGAVKTIDELARQGDPFPLSQTNQLFHNLGNGRFQEVSATAGAAFQLREVSRGAAIGDVDNDGDTDILIGNNSGPTRLLLNTRGQDQRWLGLRLVLGPAPSTRRDAYGASATVTLGSGRRLTRRVRADGSYCSSNDPRLLFGLGGDASAPREVEVTWPDGAREAWDWSDRASGRYHELVRSTGRAR